jgi:GMP synthase (glutamine-hydrolysing)
VILNKGGIAVVDFGGQYAHLIATKVRRMQVHAEIVQPEAPLSEYAGCEGIIVSGSPSLASQGEGFDYNHAIFDLDLPILGFCFGHQEIAKRYGGEVSNEGQEWGATEFQRLNDHPILAGTEAVETVWMSHFDTVTGLGPDFVELGRTPEGRNAAIASDKLRRYGFQFHPEVDDTVNGERMIANFLFKICGCGHSWTMERYLEQQLDAIRAEVGDRSVFLLASGGVDSTVAAKLLVEALGPERVELLHVDNGLMRKDESAKVVKLFESWGLGSHLHFVDASEHFLAALAGVTDPEKKREIIGHEFVQVFSAEAKKLDLEGHLLGQGTIYPDTIESGGTARADKIKMHHNRAPIIEEMIAAGRVIEPLADLYKVEVRELGELMGIPHDLVWRHPFPGPGLGVRLLCSDGDVDASTIARSEAGLQELGIPEGVEAQVLPLNSVGVKADLRSYEHPVMITGDLSWEDLLAYADRIFKSVPGVNRAVWNLGGGTPGEFTLLSDGVRKERLDLLREADAIVMDALRAAGLYAEIWQCPTVSAPLAIDGKGSELVIVRPVLSDRAMTAAPARLPAELLRDLGERLGALPGVSGVCLDITSKPPGTIEWE